MSWRSGACGFENGVDTHCSTTGLAQERIETTRQLGRQCLEQIAGDKADVNQVAKVNAVLIAVGHQFHAHEAGQ